MDDAKDLLVSVPAWGIFAFLVIKVVLDFIAKRDAAASAKATTDGGLKKPPTPEDIAAVIRDQQERQEILESLRGQSATQERIATALDHVAAAQERIAAAQDRIAAAQDRQTQLIERQVHRTRALAEAIATSRQTLDRLVASVAIIERGRDDATPIPMQSSSGNRTS